MMIAEEFQTIVLNGSIHIPDYLKTEFEGCKVKVIVLKSNYQSDLPFNLRQLFKDTQSLPQSQAISEAEIIAEVTAYRFES
ncbi:MAG: hypothetical protein HC916_21880 [Coleofasciculaceae cyanobacterium SM2_1_6]|nr:hypothetical protein [Coleofasciculaceae cyanobacterium SM2_1_6]